MGRVIRNVFITEQQQVDEVTETSVAALAVHDELLSVVDDLQGYTLAVMYWYNHLQIIMRYIT